MKSGSRNVTPIGGSRLRYSWYLTPSGPLKEQPLAVETVSVGLELGLETFGIY